MSAKDRFDDRRRNFHTTIYDGKQYDLYPYHKFAVDDGDEWRTWQVTHYPDLPKRELELKRKSYEQQQIAIYQMLDGEPMAEGAFCAQLAHILEANGQKEVSMSLSANDEEKAFTLYKVKKDIYAALVAQKQAEEEAEAASAALGIVKQAEEAAKTGLERARKGLVEARTGGLIVPSVVGLASGLGLPAAGDPAALFVSAVAKVPELARHVPMLHVPPGLPEMATEAVAQLAGIVGGPANASLAIAGIVGIGAAATCKAMSYAGRRGMIRRARADVQAAMGAHEVQHSAKRRLDADLRACENKRQRADDKVTRCVEVDKSGARFFEPETDEDEEDDESDTSEDGEEDAEGEEAPTSDGKEDGEAVEDGEMGDHEDDASES